MIHQMQLGCKNKILLLGRKLGSFRINGVRAVRLGAEIGFVSHFCVVGQAGVGVNWVRFAFCRVEIGFVSHFWVVGMGGGRQIGFVSDKWGAGRIQHWKVRVNHRMSAFGVRSI